MGKVAKTPASRSPILNFAIKEVKCGTKTSRLEKRKSVSQTSPHSLRSRTVSITTKRISLSTVPTNVKGPNLVYDPNAPRSIGWINGAAKLIDILKINLDFKQAKSLYLHGWGEQCIYPKPVVGVLEINLLDIHGNLYNFWFDLVNGDSIIVNGLDVGRLAIQENISDKATLRVSRPRDSSELVFANYFSTEDENQTVERIRIQVSPKPSNCIWNKITAMMTGHTQETLNYSQREYIEQHTHHRNKLP